MAEIITTSLFCGAVAAALLELVIAVCARYLPEFGDED